MTDSSGPTPGHAQPHQRFTRRRSYRQDVCEGVILRPVQTAAPDSPDTDVALGPAVDARTYDISRDGLGMICAKSLAVGSTHAVHARGGRLVLATDRVHVVTCTQVGAAAFQIGAEFV